MIFASMYTLSDQRGTLGCWGDDLLIEADEADLVAVEAHLEKRFEVKVLARLGRWKAVRQDWVLEASVAVRRRDWKLHLVQWQAVREGRSDHSSAHGMDHRVQDSWTLLARRATGAALRDGDQKLDGDDRAAFRSALGSVLYGTGQT